MLAYESIKLTASVVNPSLAKAKQKESDHFNWYWNLVLEYEGRMMELAYSCGSSYSLYKPRIAHRAGSIEAFEELARGHDPFSFHGHSRWLATGNWEKLTYGNYLTSFMNKGTGRKLIGTSFEDQCDILRKVLKPVEPDLRTVIYCVVSDYEMIENCRDFEDFCAEFGYNNDSIKELKTYEACKEQSGHFRKLISDSRKLERICVEARVLDDMYNATPEEQLAEINERLVISQPAKAVAADFGL